VSVLEAFAAGLPVVSTGTGDIRNMVRDGESGTLIPREEPAAMAAAIAALLQDPERAVALARRARREIEKYTWARVRNEWEAVYAGRAA
jgi:glycosyltransferase involved in cell wall biosynthesis